MVAKKLQAQVASLGICFMAAMTLVAASAQQAFALASCTIADNYSTDLGEITWDPQTYTVTIDNVGVRGEVTDADGNVTDLIQLEGDGETVTIKLIGSSTVDDTAIYGSCMSARGVNLEFVPGDSTASLSINGESDGHAIEANGNMTVSNCALMTEGEGNSIVCKGVLRIAGDGESTLVIVKNVGETTAISAGSFETAGSVSIDGCEYGIAADRINVAGGCVNVANAELAGLRASDSMSLGGGTVIVDVNPDEANCLDAGNLIDFCGSIVELKGGMGAVLVHDGGTVNASGGSLSINGCGSGIYLAPFTGGTVWVRGTTITCDVASGAISADTVSISSGTTTLKAGETGIECHDAFTMTGGTAKVTSAYGAVFGNRKLSVTGGRLTLACGDKNYFALDCPKGVTTKPACISVTCGRLQRGATFATGGSTYVVGYGDDYKNVTLKSYGGSSKAPTVNTVKYGKASYKVRAIGAKAFSTAKGKLITKLTLGANVKSIAANAFKGTKKLATLNVKSFPYSSAKIASKAFKSCGKSSGAKLTVLCKKGKAAAVKKLFVKKGMSKKATFK